MRRLYYATQDLDDAEVISDEVHAEGIDDHHFLVVSRDEEGLKSHHLHGEVKLEGTKVLCAKQRAMLIGIVALALIGLKIAYFGQLFTAFNLLPVIFIAIIALVAAVAIRLTGATFDTYFMSVFNQHIDNGEALVVIDVPSNLHEKVVSILSKHPKAKFLADSSSLGSPIPA